MFFFFEFKDFIFDKIYNSFNYTYNNIIIYILIYNFYFLFISNFITYLRKTANRFFGVIAFLQCDTVLNGDQYKVQAPQRPVNTSQPPLRVTITRDYQLTRRAAKAQDGDGKTNCTGQLPAADDRIFLPKYFKYISTLHIIIFDIIRSIRKKKLHRLGKNI